MRYSSHRAALLRAALGALMTLALAPTAGAVDGVIEINQAKATVGGVTPSDAPGLPVTIDTAGSYRLTSDLAVPNSSTRGIEITHSNVTLDLNGFEIACDSCASSAGGEGITAASSIHNVAIRNGTIRNVGGNGISLFGTQTRIDEMRIIDTKGIGGINVGSDCLVTNTSVVGAASLGFIVGTRCRLERNVARDSGSVGISTVGEATLVNNVSVNSTTVGISCSSACAITGNAVTSSGTIGISTGANSVIAHNTSNDNGSHGIEAPQSSVVDNVAVSNSGLGLSGDSNTGYARNVFSFNNSNGAQVGGGVLETGSNVCHGDLVCP